MATCCVLERNLIGLNRSIQQGDRIYFLGAEGKLIKVPVRAVQWIEEKELLDLPLSYLGFSTRAIRCLSSESLYLVRDLTKKTEKELSRIPNLGGDTVREIRDRLQKNGLTLPV